MNNLPLVSVIMPAYNRAHFIVESLECVLGQTYSNWECIIVDDGSTDNTQDVLQPILIKDSRFKYFKKENEGAAQAKNYGILKSKGTYILPLDSDDLIEKSYIEKGVTILQNNKQIKIVYCRAELFGAENEDWNLPEYAYKHFLIYNMIFNSSLFRRSDYDQIGGYDERSKLEDWDFWIKLLKHGGEVFQIPEKLFFYRKHKDNSITNKMMLKNEAYSNSMNLLFKTHIDEYMTFIGNPIELERERRELASIVKTADYKLAARIMNSKVFKFFRWFRNQFKTKET